MSDQLRMQKLEGTIGLERLESHHLKKRIALLEEQQSMLWAEGEQSLNYIRELKDRIALLEAALSDALYNYEYYAQYAGDYLCKKHRVAEDIAEKRALLQEKGE